MKNYICKIKVDFDGIYEWGKGFSAESYKLWKDYWYNKFNRKEHVYWRLVEAEDRASSDMLITLGCAIYLHPMGFTAIDLNSGCYSSHYENGVKIIERFSELNELRKILDELVEGTPFKYRMETEEKAVEFNI